MADGREYIYLNETELTAMLAAVGVPAWYGPAAENAVRIQTREDVNRILAELYLKEVLDWDEENAVISGMAGDAVGIIKNADVCILTGQQHEQELEYIYPSDGRLVQIAVSLREEKKLRLTVLSFEEWMEKLEEKTFFPEIIGSIQADDSIHSDAACSVMELRSTLTGEIISQIHIIDQGAYGTIYLTSPDVQRTYICSRDHYERILREWTEA